MQPLTNNAEFLSAPPAARKAALERIMGRVDDVAKRLVLGQVAQGEEDFLSCSGPPARAQPLQQFGPPLQLAQVPLDQNTSVAPPQQLPTTSDMATLSPQL